MICFWHNDALCLSPEDDKERKALAVIYYAFRAGLKPSPEEGIVNLEEDSKPSSKDLASS